MIPRPLPSLNLSRRDYSSPNSSAGPLVGAIVGISIGVLILTLICLRILGCIKANQANGPPVSPSYLDYQLQVRSLLVLAQPMEVRVAQEELIQVVPACQTTTEHLRGRLFFHFQRLYAVRGVTRNQPPYTTMYR